MRLMRSRAGNRDRAIALQPAYPGAFVNRAQAWLKKGDLVRAESDYTAATRLEANAPRLPNVPDPHGPESRGTDAR